MSETIASENSLVLYKNRPARVKHVGEKLDIELDRGEIQKVRPKDVVLLHPGPMRSLSELQPQPGEVEAAWEILAGSTTTLRELADLIYGAFTPATAWAAWQQVAEGLCFRGTPEQVEACAPEEVAQKQAAREADAAEKRAWATFLDHVHSKQIAPEESRYLREVENLALKRTVKSRVLRELGREESPENAHALLLDLGYWDHTVNPYPQRFGLATSSPTRLRVVPNDAIEAPDLPDEPRVDLTHLPAFAIDDQDTETPDDALSLERNRLWVHVADAAALASPGSAVDLEARACGATLHLPERIVHMLPDRATQQLALGRDEVSPALSFGLELDAERVVGLELTPSWVRVTRLTYQQAEARLDEEPFKRLYHLAQVYQAQRQKSGAVQIELPEVQVRVIDGRVILHPVLPLKSRTLVQEAMVMAGEAAARFAIERNIPLPFATQEPAQVGRQPETLSEMVALRRTLKPRQYKGVPAPHGGLGLEAYAQATSPLRRYLDLVVHQQLRSHLRGEKLLDAQGIFQRIGAAEAVTGSVRQVEELSDRHWILVHLLRQPEWRGEGILVDQRGPTGTVLLPELALEARVHLSADLPLDSPVRLVLTGVNLPHLDAHWRLEK
jgi:exoribonuclease II